MADTAALIATGRVLAGIADPGKDMLDFATDFSEIALSLELIGKGLDRAWDADCQSDAAFQREVTAARATARRTAQRALVDLATLVAELEASDA